MSNMKCQFCDHPSYDRYSAYISHMQSCKGKIIYDLNEQIKELKKNSEEYKTKYEDMKEKYNYNLLVLEDHERNTHNMNIEINKLEDENRRLREPTQPVYIYNDNRIIVSFVEQITPMLKECVKYAIKNGFDPMQQATQLLQRIDHPLAFAIVSGKQENEIQTIKHQLENVITKTIEEVY